MLNLSHKEYTWKMGLVVFWRLKEKRQKIKNTLTTTSIISLKAFTLHDFEDDYCIHRAAFEVLEAFYSSRQLWSNFLLKQRKQKHDITFIKLMVKDIHFFIWYNNIIAYGDEGFPLTMKGVDGNGSFHKRLMMPIS